MSNRQKYQKLLWMLLCLSLIVCAGYFYYCVYCSIPDAIRLREGEEGELDEVFSGKYVTYDNVLEAAGNDSYQINCRLFGLFPVKTVKVESAAPVSVQVSGDTIGLYMETAGVMIVDAGEVETLDSLNTEPARHIVQAGDYILQVNGAALTNKQQLIHMVEESRGKEMQLLVKRGTEQVTLSLRPVMTINGTYKLGIWVRDNIQGIGTLTYVKKDGSYGALGHGISDLDTGELLQLGAGNLYGARVLSVSRGVKGNPGELKGVITYGEEENLGIITENRECGIRGVLNEKGKEQLILNKIEVAFKQELTEGTATILSNVNGRVEEYQAEITDINYNARNCNKSFVIHVIDARLLECTGGIVQGMSGSPIIQDGKIIGAVTHVFVNDPTRGYGIFIEEMLEN